MEPNMKYTFLIVMINKDESLGFAVDLHSPEPVAMFLGLPFRKFDCSESPSDMRLMVRVYSISAMDHSGTQTEHQSSARECIQ